MLKQIGKSFVLTVAFFILTAVNVYGVNILDKKYQTYRKIEQTLEEIDPVVHKRPIAASNQPPLELGSYKVEIETKDGRVANLKNFFRKYDSPLFDYSAEIVALADQYHFDYRLLPAIAMQESNLCKKIPEDSYNCWGWGIYGGKVTKFKSYDEAIRAVSLGLKKHYIDKGLTSIVKIMSKYNPSSNGSWSRGVIHFILQLE